MAFSYNLLTNQRKIEGKCLKDNRKQIVKNSESNSELKTDFKSLMFLKINIILKFSAQLSLFMKTASQSDKVAFITDSATIAQEI